MKTTFLLSTLFLLLTASFTRKERISTPIEKPPQNLNISFLLDLSDRIDPKKNPNPTMQYYQRDVLYMKSIVQAFLNHVKQKKIFKLNDQLQVFFDPAPKSPQINQLSQQLKVSFDKNSSKKSIITTEQIFATVPIKIYQSAIRDRHYVGSDIWGFFKNSVTDYCIKDQHRNILIIITDGYMYHRNNQFKKNGKSTYITPALIREQKLNTPDFQSVIKRKNLGFIAPINNVGNLEVVVLGINPSPNNPFEGDVIKQYWGDWFKSMGIKNYYLKTAELPSDLDPVLQKIILADKP
ncbi:hypothetical protein [Pedobacter endophyticus]|uniref:VWFA domain-containing protein n=1 Tax=Pedobacter endophyticus TaxID=2789740 RepID=A0A7U3Q3H3_9SPHI|nr:hypothetical protein [Pedobacter endophyticus]QPH37846.1 hypothetical protein IZT61_12065 [Pedobacter endophyticus]